MTFQNVCNGFSTLDNVVVVGWHYGPRKNYGMTLLPWKILWHDPGKYNGWPCGLGKKLWNNLVVLKKLWDCVFDPSNPINLNCTNSNWICFSFGDLKCKSNMKFLLIMQKLRFFFYWNAYNICLKYEWFFDARWPFNHWKKNHGMTFWPLKFFWDDHITLENIVGWSYSHAIHSLAKYCMMTVYDP